MISLSQKRQCEVSDHNFLDPQDQQGFGRRADSYSLFPLPCLAHALSLLWTSSPWLTSVAGQCLHAELVPPEPERWWSRDHTQQPGPGSIRDLPPGSSAFSSTRVLEFIELMGRPVSPQAGSTQTGPGFSNSPVCVGCVLYRSVGGLPTVDVKWNKMVPYQEFL